MPKLADGVIAQARQIKETSGRARSIDRILCRAASGRPRYRTKSDAGRETPASPIPRQMMKSPTIWLFILILMLSPIEQVVGVPTLTRAPQVVAATHHHVPEMKRLGQHRPSAQHCCNTSHCLVALLRALPERDVRPSKGRADFLPALQLLTPHSPARPERPPRVV